MYTYTIYTATYIYIYIYIYRSILICDCMAKLPYTYKFSPVLHSVGILYFVSSGDCSLTFILCYGILSI
jgi:hypothetical protein